MGTKAQIWSGFIMPLMNVINNIGFAAVAAVGGILAVRGLVTVGVIASFLAYSRQFTRPLVPWLMFANSSSAYFSPEIFLSNTLPRTQFLSSRPFWLTCMSQ